MTTDPMRFLITCLLALGFGGISFAQESPDHPGNIFLAGDKVAFSAPPDTANWSVADETGKVVASGAGNAVAAGKLGIGWYRCDFVDAQGKPLGYTTTGVLAPLAQPVPADSPVCLDAASAWFARDDAVKQERFARLASLAGVSWIRDRLAWGDIEPERGAFREKTTYDTSADAQARHGLKTLQVFHATPKWATDPALDGDSARIRFPRDLRDEYNFCRAMAERFGDRVPAWEPWNEGNISNFGGHTIDEMCSLQKAAYWGLKKGNPNVTVCWNVFAGGGNALHSEGVMRNEAWPYFETYNVHTYDKPEAYLKSFEHTLDAASGRPVWLSECGIGLKFIEGSERGELTPEQELDQAMFIPRSYASSLFAGIDKHFFFILGNYLENVNQFGVLRFDQTPRPAYLSLAAVGRLMAGARCLGRIAPAGADGPYVYAFRSQPDGTESDLVVAWSLAPIDSPLPADLQPTAVYDYLGRPCDPPRQLGKAAYFFVLPKGSAERLVLEPPRAAVPRREGEPSSVVLQTEFAASATDLTRQAHVVQPDTDVTVPLWIYNFGDQPVAGRLGVIEAPASWQSEFPNVDVTIAPMERTRAELKIRISAADERAIQGAWITLKADFGPQGQPALAFRLASPQAEK